MQENLTDLDSSNDEKIELYIQKTENVSIPALVFMNISESENRPDFEYNDLYVLFGRFGKVENINLKGNICVVLFEKFFSACLAIQFLNSEKNYKENMRGMFNVRWYNKDIDEKLVNDENKAKFNQLYEKNIKNINTSENEQVKNQNNVVNSQQNVNMNGLNGMSPQIPFNPPFTYAPYMMMPSLINMPNQQVQNIAPGPLTNINMNLNNNMAMQFNQNQKKNYHQINNMHKNYNQNVNQEEINQPKFTCKFEILIQNDKNFAVARRLIGSKGCNMKNIINKVLETPNQSQGNSKERVKLRLRGQGSGFKEGPLQKESDDPLHLCISTKNQEDMKKACELVKELLDNIYEDYKEYCNQYGYNPEPAIYRKIDNVNAQNKG